MKRPTKEQIEKYNSLIEYLKELGSVAVAFSAGVDSTFLLFAAKKALDEKMIAITGNLNSVPKREIEEAKIFCKDNGIKHIVCEVNELEIEGFSANPKNRCYICKKTIFGRFIEVAKEKGFNVVIEGSNLDDNLDYRPGHVAIEELGIKSPLREIGLTKEDIRVLSKELDLPTWDKPSFACLSSRFVYGEEITKDKLSMVEKSEQLLFELGFVQFRVRIHGNMARIEVLPEEMGKLIENSNEISGRLKQYGFDYVAMDLIGYRTGSMNEAL